MNPFFCFRPSGSANLCTVLRDERISSRCGVFLGAEVHEEWSLGFPSIATRSGRKTSGGPRFGLHY